MKKIIALFVFMLAFGLTASAQQKKATQTAAATTTVAKVDARDQESMIGLFQYKHRELQKYGDLSADRKAALAQTIEHKIKATLNADQVEKLAKTPALMKKLTN